MAKLTVLPDTAEIEIPDGSYVKEYIKDGSGLLFGCEVGRCGICLCSVLKGMENLSPKSQSESEVLIRSGANPNQRLACQLKILKGEASIEY